MLPMHLIRNIPHHLIEATAMGLHQSYPFRCFMMAEGIMGITGIIIDIININKNAPNLP